ncbi:MAG: DNA repair protein RadA, partial [Acidobacteriota bacterium]
ALFGEVGLLGEIRAVSRPADRIREAVALGFRRCAAPASSSPAAEGIVTTALESVADLVALLAHSASLSGSQSPG